MHTLAIENNSNDVIHSQDVAALHQRFFEECFRRLDELMDQQAGGQAGGQGRAAGGRPTDT